MRYGIVTANLGDYADPRVAVRLARAAEAAGWEAFFVWDHLGFVRGVPSGIHGLSCPRLRPPQRTRSWGSPSPRWRAARELLTLFAHQWKTGKAPHIVFNPQVPPESYFPGAEHWACAAASPDAPPAPPYTSCLCQPPVHVIAVLRIWEVAKLRGEKAVAEAQGFLQEIYPRVLLGA